MSLKPARVREASIKATFIPGDVSPLHIPENLRFPICFSEVFNLQKTTGTYTPNNDTEVIRSFSDIDQANFILLIVDQPAVISLASGANANLISNMCVQRFIYTGLQTLPSFLTTLSFNGAAVGPEVPMTQAVACNWTLFYGVAKLS